MRNEKLKFRMWFKYGRKTQKLIAWCFKAIALYLRYAPVTVGSGRVELTCET